MGQRPLPGRVLWMFQCPSSPPPTPSRKEEAVRKLKSSSQLVISIALGRPIPLPRHPSRHPPGRPPGQHSLHRGRWGPPAARPLPSAWPRPAPELSEAWPLPQGPATGSWSERPLTSPEAATS